MVEAATGRRVATAGVAASVFAEGLTKIGSNVYVISWRSGKGFTYSLNADGSGLRATGTFTTPLSDGWGLAASESADELYATDASDKLHVLSLPEHDEDVLTLKRSVTITDDNRALRFANELETIQGEVYANIIERPCLARIDPQTGKVTAWINLSDLKDTSPNDGLGDVLNGIAYDDENDKLYVTGKLWPTMFELKLREVPLEEYEAKLSLARTQCTPPASLPNYGYP
jgi:glutamine cyclotransferase